MKKFYFAVGLVFILSSSYAQIINIPNAAFKTRLLSASTSNQVALNSANQSIKIDSNLNGEIEIAEALLVYNLDLSFCNIQNVSGIENFSNLRILNADGNIMTSLDCSALSNLESLSCKNNNLSSLNCNGLQALKILDFSNNQMNVFNTSELPALENLKCVENGMNALVLFGDNLNRVECDFNDLSTLDVMNLPNLVHLECNDNSLVSFYFNGMPNLEHINCSRNLLTQINVTGLPNLKDLRCFENYITSLNVSGLTALEMLECYSNELEFLTFAIHPQLTFIDCSYNSLSDIDISGVGVAGSLLFFTCNWNTLQTLNIKNGHTEYLNIADNVDLQYICADSDEIATIESVLEFAGLTDSVVDSNCNLGLERYSLSEFIFYPNPASNVLNIQHKQTVKISSITIYNALGQVVLLVPNAENVSQIDISTLKTGHYFIKVNADNETALEKFIKL